MSCADFLELFFVDERVKGARARGVIGMWAADEPRLRLRAAPPQDGRRPRRDRGWGFVRGGMGASRRQSQSPRVPQV